MFDDQLPPNKQQAPGNLPMGEPEDIFADAGGGAEASAPVERPASALDRGVLRPKQPVQQVVQPIGQMEPAMVTPPAEMYPEKGPAITRGIITIIVVLVVLGVLGGGGWWIYNSFIKTNTPAMPTGLPAVTETTATDETTEADATPAESEIVPVEDTTLVPSEESGAPTGNIVKEMADEQVLFGEPVDKDADGLDDSKEVELGTDPNNWDTDGDELGDGDELTWKTNPLNPDTDGDTYKDGVEVKNGYSPIGPGKIFEVPKQ